MAKEIEHTPSSGNVFADLGLVDADEQLTKAQEAVRVAHMLESKLTKKKPARRREVQRGARVGRRTNRE